jgi:dihydroflavonol-4-reductase
MGDQCQSTDVERLVRDADVVFLAGGRVSRSEDAGAEMHELFVEGTKAAFAGLVKAGVARAVLVSSSGTLALGTDPDRIYSEEDPASFEHLSHFPYYRAKYFGERAALEISRGKLELVIVHPSLLLGPGDLRESSTGDVRRFLDGSVFAVPSGGIAFIDVRDAAQGIVQAGTLGRSGERYILNSANMTVRAFFERLARMTGLGPPRLTLPRQTDAALWLYDAYARGLRAIGGVPPIDRASIELGQHFFYCSSGRAELELGFRTRDPGETLYDTVCDLVNRQVVVRPPAFRS